MKLKIALLALLIVLLLLPTVSATYFADRQPLFISRNDPTNCVNLTDSAIFDDDPATWEHIGTTVTACYWNMTFEIPSSYINSTDKLNFQHYYAGNVNYILNKNSFYNSTGQLQNNITVQLYSYFTGTWGTSTITLSYYNWNFSTLTTLYTNTRKFGSGGGVNANMEVYELALLLDRANAIDVYFNGTSSDIFAYNNVSVNFTCNSTVPVSLYYNGTPISNASAFDLSIGQHVFWCNNSDGVNESLTAYVNPYYTVVLLLNGSNESVNATWNYGLNVSCQSNTVVTLMMNGTVITNDAVNDLSAGYYEFYCNNTAGDNRTLFFNLSKASTTTTLTLDGATSNKSEPYPGSIVALGISDYGLALLYRNDSLVSNPENLVFGAGSYLYVANYSGDENHTGSAAAPLTLTVLKANSTIYLSVSSSVINEDQSAEINCSGIPSSVLYFNGSVVSNNYLIGPIVPGTYPVVCNYSGDMNYNASSYISDLIVIDIPEISRINAFVGAYAGLGIGIIIAYSYFKGGRKK